MDLTAELNKALQDDPAEPMFRFAGTVVVDVAHGADMGDLPVEVILDMYFS